MCAPRAAPEAAARALAVCPLPWEIVPGPSVFPEPEAALLAGLYRRGPGHAPAPSGLPEVVQVPGPAFGGADHATTLMCLAALPMLPPAPGLDVGCGAGLLALAWARLSGLPVQAVDLDPDAVRQTRASAACCGPHVRVHARRGAVEHLDPGVAAGRVLLANLPAPAHRALLGRLDTAPRAAVLSGLRPAEADDVLTAWRRRGLRLRRRSRRGRFECLVLGA